MLEFHFVVPIVAKLSVQIICDPERVMAVVFVCLELWGGDKYCVRVFLLVRNLCF